MSSSTVDELAGTIERLCTEARKHSRGYSCAEVFDGRSLVWLEATRDANGRITWKLDNRRVAKSDIKARLDRA